MTKLSICSATTFEEQARHAAQHSFTHEERKETMKTEVFRAIHVHRKKAKSDSWVFHTSSTSDNTFQESDIDPRDPRAARTERFRGRRRHGQNAALLYRTRLRLASGDEID